MASPKLPEVNKAVLSNAFQKHTKQRTIQVGLPLGVSQESETS